MMARDAVLGRRNPWSELFDPAAPRSTAASWDYLKENIDYPYYMIRDRFAGPEGQSRCAPSGAARGRSSS